MPAPLHHEKVQRLLVSSSRISEEAAVILTYCFKKHCEVIQGYLGMPKYPCGWAWESGQEKESLGFIAWAAARETRPLISERK